MIFSLYCSNPGKALTLIIFLLVKMLKVFPQEKRRRRRKKKKKTRKTLFVKETKTL